MIPIRRPIILFLCILALCLAASKVSAGEETPADDSRVTLRIAYHFEASGSTSWVRMVVLVPRTIPSRQEVSRVAFDPEPLRIFDANGNRYAEFFFEKPPREFHLEILSEAHLLRYDLEAARAHAAREAPPAPLPPDELRLYLLGEPNIQKDDPAIAEAARGLGGEDDLATVRKI